MKEIPLAELKIDPFTVFGEDWMALTAGNQSSGFNTMTVAWGQFGSLWERGLHTNSLPTISCYVRPSRHTKAFMDHEEYFTLSHFPKEYKKALGYLGSHSGRDGDKITPIGLTPVFAGNTTYFAEADLVFLCRKLYSAPLAENGFVDRQLVDFNYPQRDFHTMYIGGIVKILIA